MDFKSKALMPFGGLAVLLGSFFLTLAVLDGLGPSTPSPNAAAVSMSVNGSDSAIIAPGTTYTISYASQNVKSCVLRYTNAAGNGEQVVAPNAPSSGQSGGAATYTLGCIAP